MLNVRVRQRLVTCENVIEYRSPGVGGTLCCQSQRAFRLRGDRSSAGASLYRGRERSRGLGG